MCLESPMRSHFAPALEAGGRKFESYYPDRSKTHLTMNQLDAFIISVYFPHIHPANQKTGALIWKILAISLNSY